MSSLKKSAGNCEHNRAVIEEEKAMSELTVVGMETTAEERAERRKRAEQRSDVGSLLDYSVSSDWMLALLRDFDRLLSPGPAGKLDEAMLQRLETCKGYSTIDLRNAAAKILAQASEVAGLRREHAARMHAAGRTNIASVARAEAAEAQVAGLMRERDAARAVAILEGTHAEAQVATLTAERDDQSNRAAHYIGRLVAAEADYHERHQLLEMVEAKGYEAGLEAAAKVAEARAIEHDESLRDKGTWPDQTYVPDAEWHRRMGAASEARAEAAAIRTLSASPAPSGNRPVAWMRGVHSPGTPNGPDEYDYEACPGEDQPDGKGWFPLYRNAPSGERESIVAYMRARNNWDGERLADAIARGDHLPTGGR